MPEILEAQIPRIPPCIFPTITRDGLHNAPSCQSSTLHAINGRWDSIEAQFKEQGTSLPVLLKAAWALTLQCYVSSELISFEYHGPESQGHANGATISEGVNGINDVHDSYGVNSVNGVKWNTEGTGDTPKQYSELCLFRIDESECLMSFLKRMQDSCTSCTPSIPERDGIILVTPIPTARTWNTSIRLDESRRSLGLEDPLMPLSVTVTMTKAGRLSSSLNYSALSIPDDMARSIVETFNHILTQMLTCPRLTMREIEPCSVKDRQTIQQITKSITPVKKSLVHDLIDTQCRLNPSRFAVCSWEGDFTYGELDDLSSRLAHHLIGLGVKTENYVFNCFEKSMWAIVARLAILRAGGAYVSIHAANPPAYIDAVIKRTDCKLLITTPKFKSQFERYVDNVLGITPEFVHQLPQHRTPPVTSVQPENACLVLFTSGSTGEPKGIVQTHQSYSTAILNYANNFGLGPHTRFLQFDDYAFDISNLELFTPLIIGGCCCVPSPMKLIQDVANNINALRANITFLTPTVAVKLDPASVPTLETLCVGGEPMQKDLINKWANSRTKLVNQYGMGEVAICCAFNDSTNPDRSDFVGRPTSGTIWVVDPVCPDRLMPVGAVGEFLMEGPHLSRHYLDQVSRRSDAVFLSKVPTWMHELHPDRISSRLYRSGDLGRLHHDGTFQYIGRKDTVLKLDGCRVEALEVEYQARKCLTPNDAVIVDLLGQIDGVADPVLSAFVYLHDHPNNMTSTPKGDISFYDAETDPTAMDKVKEIKLSIAETLPPYMIPKSWLLTNWVPKTASNKTDRKKIHMAGQKHVLKYRNRDNLGCGLDIAIN